ncbi:hypothetical protein L21SP2_2483 [Salinispira pacifica]|uniref:Uncharacterized protein n=1 Tax=Salinispira pacifica TaxID=1307761 RepID=V5WKW6_9SPIO|nr:hypothetical protein L21SP2_2483 [Salinispira pacifica]
MNCSFALPGDYCGGCYRHLYKLLHEKGLLPPLFVDELERNVNMRKFSGEGCRFL